MLMGEVVPAAASYQLVPSLVVYWYFVIEAPPSEPAVKAIEAVVSPGVAESEVGAAGAVTEPTSFSTRLFDVSPT